MKNYSKLSFLIAVLAMSMLPAQFVIAGEEQRAAQEVRTSGTLGQQVMRSLILIMELMADSDGESDLVAAKEVLDDLRERHWQSMNEFEKSTVLNFYVQYYVTLEDYQGAIRALEEILRIEGLREETRMRTQRTLGQLYAAEEDDRN